jgi:Holliday junction resolvase RusA-like endonuclease
MAQEALLPPLTPSDGPIIHAVTGMEGRTWRFEVLGKPEAKGSWKAFVSKSTKRAIAIPANKTALERWQRHVANTAELERPGWLVEPVDGPVFVTCIFVRERPASHFRSDGRTLSKAATRFPDTQPDGDKLARAIHDALEGIAYTNDARIVGWPGFKRWAIPGEREKVEVEFTVL